MIAIEKSLPEETKKIWGVALGENLLKSDKNVVAITFFFQINLIKNVGTNLKTGASCCLF